MMGNSKGNWGIYGLQAFGISVLGPLLFYLINPIIEHFKGNRDAVAYAKTYFELIWIEGVDVFVGFYNHRYDAAGVQNGLMRAGMVLSVYVNRKQWKDKSYGTKEKPMPVSLHRIISGDNIEERNKLALWRDSLQPSGDFVDSYLPPKAVQRMRNTPDSVNYKFAEYYLRYLLPEDEFERLFEEE